MNIQLQTSSTWRVWVATALAGAALLGCGGGGGGGTTTTTTPTTTTIVDSFGVAVENGFGAGDSGGDGSAGDGAAIPNRPVLLTDSTGKTATATTDLQGYYRVKLTGFTPPFVVKVTKADGSTRTSLSTAALKPNGFITINITGLTEKVASDVAIAGGKKGASELTPAIVAANASVIQTSINNLKTQLASVITAAGVNLATFDPISVPFKTDSTGYDKVLDLVKVTLAADGSTVVTPVATTTTPTTGFSGNWRQTINVSGVSSDTGLVPGTSVLTQAQLANVTVATAANAIVPSRTTVAGYTVTTNGTTSTMTGPGTNLTIVINHFDYAGFAQSGTGAVGTRVSYTLNASFTYNGTLDGTPFNNTTLSTSIGYTYVREN
jgi:hypothetical protein